MPEPFTPPAEHAHHRWHWVLLNGDPHVLRWMHATDQWTVEGRDFNAESPSFSRMRARYIQPIPWPAIPPVSEIEPENG